MGNYTVRLVFSDGINTYTFLFVQSILDPVPAMKATVIEGTRGSGSIVISGGKKSIEIRVRGILLADDYVSLTDLIAEMRNKVTTNVATLTLKHFNGGEEIDWSYLVRRIEEINFPESMRTNEQEYEATFLVIAYS